MSGILQDSLEVKDSIPEGAEEFWTELLGRESPVDVPEYNDPHARLDGLMDPISEEEVVKYLSQKSSGAPGPDGLTWRMLKEDKVKELTSLFNLWLYLGSVPSRICERRTTLIPKAPGTTDPSQYRPITVGSVLLRLSQYLGGKVGKLASNLTVSERFSTG